MAFIDKLRGYFKGFGGKITQNVPKKKTVSSSSYYRKRTRSSTPTSYNPYPDAANIIKTVTENVQPIPKAFESVMPWSNAFDETLARQSSEQQSKPYFQKQWEDYSRGAVGDYAQRGLLGSSTQTSEMGSKRFDVDQAMQDAIEKLYQSRYADAKDWYETQRKAYYDQPTTYVAPAYTPKIDVNAVLEQYKPTDTGQTIYQKLYEQALKRLGTPGVGGQGYLYNYY